MVIGGFAGQGAMQMWVCAASTAMFVVCIATGARGSWELLCACEVVGRLGSPPRGWKKLFGKPSARLSHETGALLSVFVRRLRLVSVRCVHESRVYRLGKRGVEWLA